MTLFQEITTILRGAGWSLLKVMPWIIGATLLSTWVMRAKFQDRITAYVKHKPNSSIFAAAALGAFLPLCSCTVLPLARGLLRAGVTLPVLMAFWASAPLMSIAQFATASSVLGVSFGFGLLAASLSIGIGAAYFFRWRGAERVENMPAAGGCCKVAAAAVVPFWKECSIETLRLVSWLAIAFLLEGVFMTWIPRGWVPSVLGSQNPLAIPVAVLVGLPLYMSEAMGLGLSAGLLASGAAPGAILGLLIAGGMTSIPAMIASVKLLGWKMLRLYLLVTIVGAMIIAHLFQFVVG